MDSEFFGAALLFRIAWPFSFFGCLDILQACVIYVASKRAVGYVHVCCFTGAVIIEVAIFLPSETNHYSAGQPSPGGMQAPEGSTLFIGSFSV